jgi:WD40 repeat protein
MSPSGAAAAFRDGFGGVCLWELTGARPLKTVLAPQGEKTEGALAFTADGKRLVILNGPSEGPCTVSVVAVATGNVSRRFRTRGPGSVVLAPDGRTVAVFTAQDGLRLWDMETGKDRRLGRPSEKGYFEVSFSPDGKAVLAADAGEQTLHVWDVDSAKERRVRLPGLNPERPVLLSPDRKTVAGYEKYWSFLCLWDAATGRPLLHYPCHIRPPCQLAFSPGGALLTSYASDGAFRWDVRKGALLARTEPEWRRLTRLSPDGAFLASVEPRKVNLYDCRSGVLTRELRWDAGDAVELALSPRGDKLALSTSEGKIRIWELDSGRLRRVIDTTHTGKSVSWVLFTPDGLRLATGNGPMRSDDGWAMDKIDGGPHAHLWEVATGRHLGELTADKQKWQDVAFACDWERCLTPDGKYLLVSSGGNFLAWDVAARREVDLFEQVEAAEWRTTASGPVAVSPDGRLLARFDDTFSLRIWEAASGRIVYRFDQSYSSIAFAPDSRVLATGCQENGSILLWDLALLFRAGAPATPGNGTLDRRALWEALANSDAPAAYRAIGELATDEKTALALLAEQLRPVREPAPGELNSLGQDLDSDDFTTRERACRRLAEMREAAAPVLRRVEKGTASLESRRRAAEILARLKPRAAERLREARAVQVLEYLGTSEARRLLHRFADGIPEARLTQEAKAALQRLARQP